MRPLARADIDAVLAPFAEARPFPSAAYVDPALFAFEKRHLLDGAWQIVGLARDVTEPGAWLRTPLAEETLVVVRGADGGLRAFFDACMHRGARVFDGDGGCARAFTCRYHGWRWDDAGALRDAPFAPKTLDPARAALREGRAETRFGLLFATTDRDAPPLDEAMGEAPPWLARASLDRVKPALRTRWLVSANWKLVVENFQESHHFVRVHPMLERRTPSDEARSFLGDGRWLGGVMPIAEPHQTVSLTGRRHGRPLLVPAEDARLVHDALLFPLSLTSLQPDYLLVYRLDPRGPRETIVRHELLVHEDATGDAPDARDERDVIDFWAQVHDEDRRICEEQQRVMDGGGYQDGCYTTNEDGVHAFDRLVARALLAARRDDGASAEGAPWRG
jgi:Rieske 2Fe-2S family protein